MSLVPMATMKTFTLWKFYETFSWKFVQLTIFLSSGDERMTQLMNRLVKKVMLLMTKAEFEKNWSGSTSRSVQWTFMEPHLVMVMLSTMMVTHSQWPWIKRWNSWVGFQELCFAPTPTLSFIIWISSDSLLNLNPLQPFSMLHSTWMSTRQIKTKRLDCALDSHTSSRLDITEVSESLSDSDLKNTTYSSSFKTRR